MPSKSKAKGNRIERELVKLLESKGFESKRAWGSNGASIGEDEEVDVVTKIYNKKFTIQVKGRRKIAEYLKPNLEKVNAQVLKEDRGPFFIVLEVNDFLSLVKNR